MCAVQPDALCCVHSLVEHVVNIANNMRCVPERILLEHSHGRVCECVPCKHVRQQPDAVPCAMCTMLFFFALPRGSISERSLLGHQRSHLLVLHRMQHVVAVHGIRVCCVTGLHMCGRDHDVSIEHIQGPARHRLL